MAIILSTYLYRPPSIFIRSSCVPLSATVPSLRAKILVYNIPMTSIPVMLKTPIIKYLCLCAFCKQKIIASLSVVKIIPIK